MRMKKNSQISPDLHVRIQKTKTMEQLTELISSREGKSQKVNSIINEALEMALPYMLEGGRPQAMDDILEKYTQRVIMNTNRQAARLNTTLNKLAILSITNESIVGTIVQELEYFMAANGINVSEELMHDFMDTLPERFEKEKAALIEKLQKGE